MWLRHKPVERTGGFVLVEVLVTAAVAAVLLAALMRALSSVWGGIGAVREETEAMLVARALIETSTPRKNLVPSTQQGRTGRYAWTILIADTGLQIAQGLQGAPAGSQAQSETPQSTAAATPGAEPSQSAGDPEPTKDRMPPWTLFRIDVAVLAPSGRRTTLETLRLSRPVIR